MYIAVVLFVEATQSKATGKAFSWEINSLQRGTRSPLVSDQSALWAGWGRTWPTNSSVCAGWVGVGVGGWSRCERFLQEDCSGGRLQPGSRNHPAGRRPVHQDFHQRSHDKRLLHRRPVLQWDHGGRTRLHGTYPIIYQRCFVLRHLGQLCFSDWTYICTSIRVCLCCFIAPNSAELSQVGYRQ